jgi:alanine racemase
LPGDIFSLNFPFFPHFSFQDVPMQPFPTWVEIDLAAIAQNTHTVLSVSQTALMAVVKANAYGFGAVEVAKTVLSAGAAQLAVARYGEAAVLRQAGITAPLLVFGMTTDAEVDAAIAQQVTLTIHSLENARQLAARAAAAQRPLKVHLKFDSGFGRLGLLPEDLEAALSFIQEHPLLQVDGVYSHLAMADEVPDHPVTAAQIQVFNGMLQRLADFHIQPQWIHMANSAGAFSLPQARFNMVRVGTALLGMKPFYFEPLPAGLQRAIRWKAQLASCKRLPAGAGIGYGHSYHTAGPEWIGVIPAGYGDGFRRLPGNEVLIDGQRVPVVGRVCNDMCMLRLPHAYAQGSEVVLIGQQGNEEITVDELVDRWHTSQADITSSINTRVPRVYASPASSSSNSSSPSL